MDHPEKPKVRLVKPASYEVGRNRPPASGKIKKGEVRNPKGRPRGSKNRPKVEHGRGEHLEALFLEEAYRPVVLPDGRTIPIAKAVIRSLAVDAAKSDRRAQSLFLDHLRAIERGRRAEREAYARSAMEYKVFWEDELERRRLEGRTGPDPIPHPDHVIVEESGEVRFTGPTSRSQKLRWDRLAEKAEGLKAENLFLRAYMDKYPDRLTDMLEKSIILNNYVIKRTNEILGDYPRPDKSSLAAWAIQSLEYDELT